MPGGPLSGTDLTRAARSDDPLRSASGRGGRSLPNASRTPEPPGCGRAASRRSCRVVGAQNEAIALVRAQQKAPACAGAVWIGGG